MLFSAIISFLYLYTCILYLISSQRNGGSSRGHRKRTASAVPVMVFPMRVSYFFFFVSSPAGMVTSPDCAAFPSGRSLKSSPVTS